MVPGGGGLALLPARVGRNRTLEIVLGADKSDAQTAADNGCMLSPVSLVLLHD